jgi:hypothetical protein
VEKREWPEEQGRDSHTEVEAMSCVSIGTQHHTSMVC